MAGNDNDVRCPVGDLLPDPIRQAGYQDVLLAARERLADGRASEETVTLVLGDLSDLQEDDDFMNGVPDGADWTGSGAAWLAGFRAYADELEARA